MFDKGNTSFFRRTNFNWMLLPKFFFFLRFHLFIHERERERQRGAETGRGRSRLLAREPDVGLDPWTQDHALSHQAVLLPKYFKEDNQDGKEFL